jgi:hypothetical protein
MAAGAGDSTGGADATGGSAGAGVTGGGAVRTSRDPEAEDTSDAIELRMSMFERCASTTAKAAAIPAATNVSRPNRDR